VTQARSSRTGVVVAGAHARTTYVPPPSEPLYKKGMPDDVTAPFPPPELITTTPALAAACARLRADGFLTVDTEFMREKTYWPELCLVQVAGSRETIIIDALAPGLNLSPLGEILADPTITKVFHAARQDVEIFVLLFGDTPRPLFDTQVAAMVAGYGDQVGYDSLVSSLTGATIDKTYRFTDWAIRPLSTAQLRYAAADVTYLREVYQRLLARLAAENRLDWVGEEMAALQDAAAYRTDPEAAWERLRPRTSNRRFLAGIRALAAWREREARQVNIPRQRLLKDEALLEIAATNPRSVDALARVRGVTRGQAESRIGVCILDEVARVVALPEADLPLPPPPREGGRPSAALVALLKVVLAARCEDHHVAPRLVASADDIDRLAAEDEPDVPALHGWRRKVFGDTALALKEGRVSVGIDGRRIRLMPVPNG
jgi:ribonuclease D